jgi:hypothetical protein
MATSLATRPVEVATAAHPIDVGILIGDTAALLRITTFPPESFPVARFGAPREWLTMPRCSMYASRAQ